MPSCFQMTVVLGHYFVTRETRSSCLETTHLYGRDTTPENDWDVCFLYGIHFDWFEGFCSVIYCQWRDTAKSIGTVDRD